MTQVVAFVLLATVLGVLITLWRIAILVTQKWADLASEERQRLELTPAT